MQVILYSKANGHTMYLLEYHGHILKESDGEKIDNAPIIIKVNTL